MKPKSPAPAALEAPHDGTTRPTEAPLNEGVAEAFREVEPAGFADDPAYGVEAAVADPDVDDSEGGE